MPLWNQSLQDIMAEALSSQHTTTFPDLLNQAQASVVVSTYQAGKLILLRSNGKSLNTHFVSLAKPMGVAYANNRLSVGSGIQVIDYFNMSSVGPKIEPAGTHDSAFLPRRLHYTGDIDIHEMAFDANDELLIVNTKMSCLGRIEINHSFVPTWRPPFISGYDLTDRCHLNGLAMKHGKPKYVSSLGVSDEAAGWRKDKAFGGMIMDVDTNEFVARELSMPHSPRWYQDKLWVLESGAGQLITIEPETGEKTVIAEVPGFCRGIDFIERYALIGLSQVRETAVFAGLPLTEREQNRKCGVWIVDIETGQTAGYLVFSEGVQEIFSVQVVPGKYPALLDLNDPLLATSYSLPDNVVQNFVAPDPARLKFDQAIALHRKRNLKEALNLYREVAQLDPDHQSIRFHTAAVLKDMGEFEEAISLLLDCCQNSIHKTDAFNLLGQIYAAQQQFDDAEQAYSNAIDTDKNFALAYFNRAHVHLKRKNWTQAWADYEWRWKTPTFKPLDCPQPRWMGEDIQDKTLLIHTEQGLGDAIQFSRFLDQAKRRCKRLVLVCSERLRLLFKSLDCVDEVRVGGSLPAELFDVYCPIMSLPHVLGTQEVASNSFPYLSILPEVVVPKLSEHTSAKIGLVWSGLKQSPHNAIRSCDLKTFLELKGSANGDQREWYSLQYPVEANENSLLEAENVQNLEADMVSLAHTGALMQQLDLVVTVCTSVAHLAGAMNLPTLLLLSKVSDWRWGEDESVSEWYPSITILRQHESGNWPELISRAGLEIERRFGMRESS